MTTITVPLFFALLLPFAAPAQQMKTINLTATANPWKFTPSTFTVNVGDIVTLNISVPVGDPSADGHGFQLLMYFDDGVTIPRGQSRQVTFTATTAGTFPFLCTVTSCGIGHSNMFGTMIVNAVAVPSIDAVTPSVASIAGGTVVTITGNGFVGPATVIFGGVAATNVTIIDTSTIRAAAPAHARGVVDVEVRMSGSALLKTRAFTYVDLRRRAVRH